MNPLAGLLILPLAWIAAAAGRQIDRWVCPAVEGARVAPIERSAFGLAAGFTVLALGVLALGLLGLLSPVPVAVWCLVLAALGGREHQRIAGEILSAVGRRGTNGGSRLFWLAIALIALAALGGCFVPPVSAEWDSLSYHLADPKLYVAAHRIYYLPWESHSNFAFNMEMLYSIGLLVHSIALAKLFSFVLGLAGAAGLYRLAARLSGERMAMLALAVYCTLPLAFWEAGTAYVDLAATSYAILALLALTIMAQTGDRRFALLAGVLLGGMLGIKATALVTIALYALGLLAYARSKGQPLGSAFYSASMMGLVAVLVGCPWYIKSAVYTGNPFYPFAYSIFGGRNWDAALSVPYAAAQYNFGVGHKPSDLLLAPWNLTMYLVPGHIPPAGFSQPFNDFQTLLASLSPLFVICAIAALGVPLPASRAMRLLTGYTLAALVIWFYMTQQVRYLLPLTPVLCILSAWTLIQLANRSRITRAAAWIAGITALGFNLFVLVSYSMQQWQVTLHPADQERYVAAGLDSYPAMAYINTHAAPGEKVVCYGEPRTFYLDRGYMWGDPGHSTLIPYDELKTPQALRAWLLARGYKYILLNTTYAPLTASPGWAGMVHALTIGSGAPPVFQSRSTLVYAL